MTNDESRLFRLILSVFRVRGVTINAVSFVAFVDVIFADVLSAIITVDAAFFAVVNNVNYTGVAVIAISTDFVSLTFVVDVVILDVVFE